MKTEYIELLLTCGSWQEAQRIADALLEKHLVACVEFLEITSKNWWKGALEESKEIKLIMASLADNFAASEAVIKKLHSYETPNIHAVAMTHVSTETAAWLSEMADS